MSRFDYMNFGDGYSDSEFVAHARTYTKVQAIALCLKENDFKFMPDYCNGKPLRKPLITDVIQRQVRYYPKAPEHCGYEREGGCYTYCNQGERGSFPVWVIEFEKLKESDEE